MKLQTQINLEKTKYLLPAILLMILAVALFFGTILFFIYSFVTIAAFNSPMIFFTLFAVTFLCLGIGLAFSLLADKLVQKYLINFGDKQHPSKLLKQPVDNNKRTTVQKIFNLSNAYTVILILAIIFTIIFASLGGLDRSNWACARKDYMQSNGYYEQPITKELSFSVNNNGINIDSIDINLNIKNAVIIYTNTNEDDIVIRGRELFNEQFKIDNNGNKLALTETPSPKKNGTTEKMLFFMFDENEITKQITIKIPQKYKNSIKITGIHITAQE